MPVRRGTRVLRRRRSAFHGLQEFRRQRGRCGRRQCRPGSGNCHTERIGRFLRRHARRTGCARVCDGVRTCAVRYGLGVGFVPVTHDRSGRKRRSLGRTLGRRGRRLRLAVGDRFRNRSRRSRRLCDDLFRRVLELRAEEAARLHLAFGAAHHLQELRDCALRNGFAEVIPLRVFATDRAQERRFVRTFDAFGDDGLRKLVRQRHHRSHDRGAVRGATAAHQSATDLDRVEREAIQIGER